MTVAAGSSVWDGAASLLIGALLLVVAFLLARATGDLLIGKQASRDLLVAIEGTSVGQDLNPHVICPTVDVGDRIMGQLVDEHSGVLAKHRDIGHFLDHHHRRGQAPGQLLTDGSEWWSS